MSEIDKNTLLANIGRDRATLDALVAGLNEAQLLEPALEAGWSVKDVLAHIAAWERLCTSWLDAIARDETPERPEVGDVDATNARFYEQALRTPLGDVMAESGRSYQAIVEAVERLPAADLADEK
ncbi:MAG: ClbS/DfsB family four-helix bundle protein, partial [Chloroflexi bacterium]|nr:ClbS/DfsB family four-helix bundle protein [Chloroflexota bacterium]